MYGFARLCSFVIAGVYFPNPLGRTAGNGWITKCSNEPEDWLNYIINQSCGSEGSGEIMFTALKNWKKGEYLLEKKCMFLKDVFQGEQVKLCTIAKITYQHKDGYNYRIVAAEEEPTLFDLLDTFDGDAEKREFLVIHLRSQSHGGEYFHVERPASGYKLTFKCEDWAKLADTDFLTKFCTWQQLQISSMIGGELWDGRYSALKEKLFTYDFDRIEKKPIKRQVPLIQLPPVDV